jgi:hypothetical protein
MCWSGEASTVLATIGFTGAYLEYRKHLNKNLQEGFLDKYFLRGMTLFYFSLMEALQALNYTVLDLPGPMNSLYSLLGYLHISLQPFFCSMFIISFTPLVTRRFWVPILIVASFFASILMLSRLMINPSLPGCMAVHCTMLHNMSDILHLNVKGSVGCGMEVFRSYVGDWHIAWQWVINDCSHFTYAYWAVGFLIPILARAYRVMLYTFFCGPFLAYFLTGRPDEWAAIWCLLSIGFLSGTKIPFLEKILTSKHESWGATFQKAMQKINKVRLS